jgi:hypothetical protein
VAVCLAMTCAIPCSGSFPEEEDIEPDEEINVEDSIEFAPSSGLHDLIDFDIFEDIAKARALLEERGCGFQAVTVKKVVTSKKTVISKKQKTSRKQHVSKKKATSKKERKAQKGKGQAKGRVVETRELQDFSILLAILNVKTRGIEIVKVHPKLGGRSENVVVEPGKSNGVNTKFRIVYPEHHVVLALKRPVRRGNGFNEVVYTPYSEDLDIPAVRKAGLEYLKNVLAAAKADLARRGVRPRWGERFVEDDVALTLALIEHIDPLKFESGRYTTEKLIHETLVIMGTNTNCAYRYSTSKAGARGLFQFIPDTYKRIWFRYPEAGLKYDFVQAMDDHENAAKASFLLFDADMRTLKSEGKYDPMRDPYARGKCLASAYNCGSGKTKAAMDRYGENWPSRVPAETQIYLKKFDAVWNWLRAAPPAH